MKLYSSNDNYKLYQGSMLDMVEVIEPNSIDSIVCDPPYELNFMGKGWDNSGIAFQKETWQKCYEVLKAGGYLLAFGGSRTFHRIACAIEDAGFEIRDTIMWLYGSGFPKSMNIGLAIDKKNGVESKVVGYQGSMMDFRDTGKKQKEISGIDKLSFGQIENSERKENPIYEAQNEWQGWGTALKPSFEPIIVARKPFKGSLVDNVIEYGVGGINIDECRVGNEERFNPSATIGKDGIYNWNTTTNENEDYKGQIVNGRFPANTILTYDETDFDEVCGGFPNTKSGKNGIRQSNSQNVNCYGKGIGIKAGMNNGEYGDSGSASRYFYCAKASKKDRDEGLDEFEEKTAGELQGGRKEGSAGSIMQNANGGTRVNPYAGAGIPKKNVHPTVKPTELMQYLVRLVSPDGATILDCFNGSGSTGKAVMYENRERNKNYKYIGIELTEEYLPIAKARIEYVMNNNIEKETIKETINDTTMEQTTIFDMMYPKYKINKPIRLIEFFAGYGSQALALKYLGVEFEHWKICEWAVKSIQAYKDIHFDNINFDFSGDLTKDNLVKVLYELGISNNYNEPMTKQQIERLNINQLKTIWNNIVTTKNLVNIQQVKGENLEIVDTDRYDYILTYSFPCQDLSLAGKGKGMSDTSTRSGMLWEVERILTECHNLGTMPQILLMENVPQVHGTDNVEDFNKWQLRLEELGYKNYWQDLIATDYGIPQTRNRCFMISILGDYSYQFPPKQELKLKLKDMLEDNVNEKYYLSKKMIEIFTKNEEKQKEKGNGLRFNVSDGNVISKTITTNAGNRMDDNYIKVIPFGTYYTWEDLQGNINTQCCRAADENRNALTVACANTGNVLTNYRIRKLTPRECFRLMGVKDEDYEKCAKNQSDSSLYHLAGDSIVVNVLMAIFKELI